MRTIGVVTVARSDYGIYRPLLHRIAADPDLHLQLLVSGMHLAPQYGLTVNQIEADGFEIAARVEMLLASDTPTAIVKSMSLALAGFACKARSYQAMAGDSRDGYEMRTSS